MSRTDKTRPYWVQVNDPLNNRFRRVGQFGTTIDKDGNWIDHEWHYKPMCVRKCDCCTNKYYRFEIGRERMQWRKERQELLASWQIECWDY